MKQEKKWGRAMSVADFAAWSGLSCASTRKLIREKKLASVLAGRRRLIPVEAAEAWWQSLPKAG
jgi:hypothetical protein